MKNKTSGQIGMASLLSIAGAVLVAIVGGYYGQASRTDTKLEAAKQEQVTSVLAISQRITAVETDTISIKEDLREIKSDVKSLLKLLR